MLPFLPEPGQLARACAQLGWDTDPIANLLADPDVHALAFERAYTLAWCLRSQPRASARERADALALLTEHGLPVTPRELCIRGARGDLVQIAPPPLTRQESMREMRTGAIHLAREMADAGLSEAQIARRLVSEFELEPVFAAEAAAVAITDPHHS